MASNALFVTLDPLVRQVRLPDNRELLVSDTVGFIDRLPHALVAAFRATLEEVADADSFFTSSTRRPRTASAAWTRCGACSRRWARSTCRCSRSTTSVDALTPDERRRLRSRTLGAAASRRSTGDGIDDLIETVMASRLALDVVRMTLTFDPDDAADRERIARVYRHARVIVHESRDDAHSIVADVPRRLLDRVVRVESAASVRRRILAL